MLYGVIDKRVINNDQKRDKKEEADTDQGRQDKQPGDPVVPAGMIAGLRTVLQKSPDAGKQHLPRFPRGFSLKFLFQTSGLLPKRSRFLFKVRELYEFVVFSAAGKKLSQFTAHPASFGPDHVSPVRTVRLFIMIT